MTDFGRVLTAMVTPFTPEGEVDYRRARELAEALISSGSDGLVVTGTTGESPTLTNDEKLRLYHEVRMAIGDRATIVAGTCNYNTHESIELSLKAIDAGVDGILGTVPYYNKPPQHALYATLRRSLGRWLCRSSCTTCRLGRPRTCRQIPRSS